MPWDHEPVRRNGARLCEPQLVALQTKLLRVTDPRSESRFTERLLSIFRMHRDHEPGRAGSPLPAANVVGRTTGSNARRRARSDAPYRQGSWKESPTSTNPSIGQFCADFKE